MIVYRTFIPSGFYYTTDFIYAIPIKSIDRVIMGKFEELNLKHSMKIQFKSCLIIFNNHLIEHLFSKN